MVVYKVFYLKLKFYNKNISDFVVYFYWRLKFGKTLNSSLFLNRTFWLKKIKMFSLCFTEINGTKNLCIMYFVVCKCLHTFL